jgi:hypothetical protein
MRSDKYDWQPGMGEISGFGGDYETMCRAMVKAGCLWLDAHPGAVLAFKGYQGVFGYIASSSPDAEALSKAITEPCPDCSGAMHHAAVNACLFIRDKGWDAYVAEMTRREGCEVGRDEGGAR